MTKLEKTFLGELVVNQQKLTDIQRKELLTFLEGLAFALKSGDTPVKDIDALNK